MRKVTVTVGNPLVLIAFGLVLIWTLGWALTCCGPEGHFHYTSFGRNLGWGYNNCRVWLNAGQRITFDYQARVERKCDVTYFVNLRQPFKFKLITCMGFIDIKQSGSGQRSFIASESGYCYLRYVPLYAWKGDVEMSWRVTGR